MPNVMIRQNETGALMFYVSKKDLFAGEVFVNLVRGGGRVRCC
ncbi:MAG: hypothetical protein GXP23_01540 [Gammaproteobacteria bacterium]|nr:hypothetical protein [Gammaproteobacteria bacterium]